MNVFLHIHVKIRECSAEQTLHAQHPMSEHLSPVLSYDFLSRCKFSTLAGTPLYSSINIGSMRRTLWSKLFIGRA